MSQTEEPKNRRASDPNSGVAPTPEAIWKLLLEIRDRVVAMEALHTSQSEAFVKDDLGKPDYHGHRKAHAKQQKYAEIVENYKVGVTKRILGYISVFVVGLVVAGFVETLRAALAKAAGE